MTMALTSCCDCRKFNKLQKPIMGTTWQLVQIMAKDVKPADDSFIVVFNEDGTIMGRGDCNTMTATFTANAKRALKIENLGSTRRLCPNMEQEMEFYAMLEKVTHYEMDGTKMILLSNGTLVAIMKAL